MPDGDLCLAGLGQGAGEHGAEVGRTRGKDNLQAYGLDRPPMFFFFSFLVKTHGFYIRWLLILRCARMMKTRSFSEKKKSDLTTLSM